MRNLVKQLRAFAEFDRLHSHVEIEITKHICWKAAKRIEELEKEVRDQDYQINELTSTIEDLTIACQ